MFSSFHLVKKVEESEIFVELRAADLYATHFTSLKLKEALSRTFGCFFRPNYADI